MPRFGPSRAGLFHVTPPAPPAPLKHRSTKHKRGNHRTRSHRNTDFVAALGCFAIVGCVVFTVSILIADMVVPNHDWIADTISDLGAGKYEFIVDIGLYTFSTALIALALLTAHVDMAGRGVEPWVWWRWPFWA